MKRIVFLLMLASGISMLLARPPAPIKDTEMVRREALSKLGSEGPSFA